MNTAQIKLLVWGIVGALGLGVTGYLTLSLVHADDLNQAVSRERMFGKLNSVPEVEQRQENLISGSEVDRGLKLLDWTGKPPPEPTEVAGPQGPTGPPPKEAVADLIQVRAIRFHGDAPENSEMIFKYKAAAMVTVPQNSDGSFLRRVGDHLDGRLNQIKIAMIYPSGVEFSFDDDPTREHDFVLPTPFDLRGQFEVLDKDAQPQRRENNISNPIVRRADSGPAKETVQLTPTKFRIGTEDAQILNDTYPEILTNELSIDRHRDPVTKRYDGISIKGVKPGSIAARHGVQDGDVIKSINGHPVASKEDAIVFVKNNQDKYTEWEVEVWNKGQIRTLTYYSPKK